MEPATSPYVTTPHHNGKGHCIFHYSKVRYIHTDVDGDTKISVDVGVDANLVTYTKMSPREVLALIDAARIYNLNEKRDFK